MNSTNDVWNQILKLMERDLSPTAISTWFGDCRVLELQNDLLVLHTSSPFSKEIITTRYAGNVTDAMKELFGTEFQLKVLTESDMPAYMNQPKGAADPFRDERYTFDTFIVGGSNQFAFAAARSVADKPAGEYNPLFIYGNSGLGKTHLLYAIAHQLRSKNPDFRIVYIKGDEFTNELIGAIQTGRNSEFREKYRRADLLMVDDIQFIAGKVQTQEEFFHTFNTLYESHKQIVLTSDRPPKEMLRLEDRLRSRFEMGLMADVQPPDYETRVAIVRTKASRMGIPLPNEICVYIAENVMANIRQIEGILKKINAYIDLQGSGAVNMELVQNITREVIDAERAYTPEYIIGQVAEYYNISSTDITGKNRTHSVAVARQICIYMLRKLTNLTLEEIGKSIGRDHTTALYAIRKIEESISGDADLADTIRDITANISNK